MRRGLAALALLATLAAPSRAMTTLALLELQVDVDARIAAFTEPLTKPQKTDKARLTSISKTLHRKSKTVTTDIATAVKAAKLVERYFATDGKMMQELKTALDQFQTPLGQAYFAQTRIFGAPTSPDPYAKGRKPLANATRALTSAASATSAIGQAKELYAAARSILAAESSLAKAKFDLTPMNLDFGQVEPGSIAAPRAITVTNTGSSAILIYVQFLEYDTQGFSFFDLEPVQVRTALLDPGAHLQIEIGFNRDASSTEPVTRHLAVVAGNYSFVNYSFVSVRPGAFAQKRVTLTAAAAMTK